MWSDGPITQHAALKHQYLTPLTRFHLRYIRASALYSTVDGSRQGVFCLVGKKKIKNEIC